MAGSERCRGTEIDSGSGSSALQRPSGPFIPPHSVLYLIFKFLHVLGVILLIGNVTVTAVWKVFADRTRDARVVAFGQRLVTITDWFLTVSGIVLLIIGGYGAAMVSNLDVFGARWLVWGQVLLAISGVIWMVILVPAQIRQAKAARSFEHDGEIPDAYRRDATRWLFWGIVATVPLAVALWVMIFKPM